MKLCLKSFKITVMHESKQLYNRQHVYQLDHLAMTEDGYSSWQLMGNAARAVWSAVQQRWPMLESIVVMAGCGNNGGDGFALAAIIKKAGLSVTVITVGELSRQSAEAKKYRLSWEQQHGETRHWPTSIPDCDLIIDGLLGIGLDRQLDENWIAIIEQLNQLKVARVSIDIPSGLNADTGTALPIAFKADLTVTFIGRKAGCYVADGPDYCGQIMFDDLGLTEISRSKIPALGTLLEVDNISLPAQRKNNSYKMQFGHVVVIGGGASMAGAARLAGMAALRCGAGLVSLCVHSSNQIAASCQHPELMVTNWNQLNEAVQRASVVLVGPGLGQTAETATMLEFLATIDKPLVIDADALRVSFLATLQTTRCVITPHPGEAARILQITSQQVQQDRLAAQLQLINNWPVVSILKGAGSLVGQQESALSLCAHGHAGMATAGMGDVLSGMIAGYLAQGLSSLNAARSAVLIHAMAAEYYASEYAASGLIASDIIDLIPAVVKEIESINRD